MSRLAASSAANLANDLAAENDVLRSDLEQKVQELEEAEAVIAKVRGLRRHVATRKAHHYEQWNDTDSDIDAALYGAYADVLGHLDRIDGL